MLLVKLVFQMQLVLVSLVFYKHEERLMSKGVSLDIPLALFLKYLNMLDKIRCFGI